jgi:hypothetical protein
LARPPSVQWYYKQFLGDNKVLQMEWDAVGMHCWLLNLAMQEEPPGSLPNDMSVIRRWLRLPPSASGMCQRGPDRRESGPGCNCSDCVWRRVQPQIFTAWQLQGERWFNSGLIHTFQRKENYANRGDGTKQVRDQNEKVPKSSKDVREVDSKKFIDSIKPKPSTKKACRLPEDFVPQQDHYDLAQSLGINCEMEFQKFRDYFLGVAGSRGLKQDWPATLRNWLRNSVNYQKGVSNGTGNAHRVSAAAERVANTRSAIMDTLRDRVEQRARHNGGEQQNGNSSGDDQRTLPAVRGTSAGGN